jgi:hypothetical protein
VSLSQNLKFKKKRTQEVGIAEEKRDVCWQKKFFPSALNTR